MAEGNSEEALSDRIVTDLLPDFPKTSTRAATSCFVEEVNVYEDAFASKYGGGYAGLDVCCGVPVWNLVLTNCGMRVWCTLVEREEEGDGGWCGEDNGLWWQGA